MRGVASLEKASCEMMRLVDKLNTPVVLAVVLMLVLVVNGLLFYRYQIAKDTAAATPSVDARLAGDRDVVDPGAQRAPDAEGTAEENEEPEGEEQGALGTEAVEPEPAPGPTEDPPLGESPLVDGPAAVPGEEEPAALPVPEPAYPRPAFEQNGDYQYGDE